MFDMPRVFVLHDFFFAVEQDVLEEGGDVGFADLVAVLVGIGRGWV